MPSSSPFIPHNYLTYHLGGVIEMFVAVIVVLAVEEQEPCVSLIILGTSWRSRWDIDWQCRITYTVYMYIEDLNVMIKLLRLLMCVCLFLDDPSRFQHLQFSSRHANAEALTSSDQGMWRFTCSNKKSHISYWMLPCIKDLWMICVWYVSLQGHVTQQCCFFCCLTAGTIWACLQNHQTTLWELFAAPGCTGPTKWGERPGWNCKVLLTDRQHHHSWQRRMLMFPVVFFYNTIKCRLVELKISNDGFAKKATAYQNYFFVYWCS